MTEAQKMKEMAAYNIGFDRGKQRDFRLAVFDTEAEHKAYQLGWAAGRKLYEPDEDE